MGDAASPPTHILGYTIRSRTRIYVSYIIPISLTLLVYIAQTTADIALSCQYFRTEQPAYGAGTILLVIIPALLTFGFVIGSKELREDSTGSQLIFYGQHVLQLLLFPCFVIHRFTMRLFWSVEALFHDDDDTWRMECLSKATRTSSIELYMLIQAFAQAAPQIILQLYHMLTQDMYRNYETSRVQALCLTFSAINLAAVTTSYHRFESQRRVGRHYPWATTQQLQAHCTQLEQNRRICGEAERRRQEAQRNITNFPQSEKIMENFRATHELHVIGVDEVDNNAPNDTESLSGVKCQVQLHSPKDNATDDDKIQDNRPQFRWQQHVDQGNVDKIEVIDTVPDTPAPRAPPWTAPPVLTLAHVTDDDNDKMPALRPELRRTQSDTRRSRLVSRPLSQLETIKDMLLVNAQLYIKEHVPRPPKLLITRVEQEQEQTPLVNASPLAPNISPLTPKDVVDFYFPQHSTKVINGIQQDDFAGRTVAFFGWVAFITMRMLALATFCIFYPAPFFIVVSVHYVVMVGALWLETRFRGSWSRRLFYLLLAYIYIFVLLEIRVCFKRIRLWYGCFMVLTLVENITMTSIWYVNANFESWWFGFIWDWIVYSGVLFIATIIVYYCILRPKEVALIVEDNSKATAENAAVA